MNLKDEDLKLPPSGKVWRGKLEVIGFTIDGCMIAQRAGANRIELCDNPADGGTTASYGFIKAARGKLQVDLFPIIRPRGGNFLYSHDEFEIIKTDVKLCKELGCEGVVIGMLTADKKIDKKRCGLLVEHAYPLSVTFHRAFDRTADPFEALEDIIEIGCERILTSGQKENALDGAALIKELIQKASGRIIIMPGSGVRSDNILAIAKTTGAVEFHSSARIQMDDKISVDENEVREIIKKLSSL
ncbi:MAG: copper homeostasis protein CutC [Chitinophagaceae bacterium]|nr:copper homeostasis protein CutC [Chitinophagaceae bacterium]